MGKSTISMAMFHCYVSSPEGKMVDHSSPYWNSHNLGLKIPIFPTTKKLASCPGNHAAEEGQESAQTAIACRNGDHKFNGFLLFELYKKVKVNIMYILN